MTSRDPIRSQTMRDRPKRAKASTKMMVAAFVLFAISWPLILLNAYVPAYYDPVVVLFYYCGPLPILPAALFLVGVVMLICRR